MGTGSFPGVKCGWDLLMTTHPLLVPLSWKSTAIPLPPSGPHRACNGIILPFFKMHQDFVKALNHKWLKSDTLVDSSASGKYNWKLVYLRLILNQIITTYWTVVKDLLHCESI
jgi:hypothetical protein